MVGFLSDAALISKGTSRFRPFLSTNAHGVVTSSAPLGNPVSFLDPSLERRGCLEATEHFALKVPLAQSLWWTFFLGLLCRVLLA